MTSDTLGAHELGGEGGVYLKLMFSVQEPAGFNGPARTMLALGDQELECDGGVYLKLMFSVHPARTIPLARGTL